MSEDSPNNGDWNKHKMYVVESLKDLNLKIDKGFERLDKKLHDRDKEFYDRLNKVEREQSAMKVKSGAWGAVTGFTSTVPIWIKSLLGGG